MYLFSSTKGRDCRIKDTREFLLYLFYFEWFCPLH